MLYIISFCFEAYGALFTFLLTIPLIVTALVVMCVIDESESLVCLTES